MLIEKNALRSSLVKAYNAKKAYKKGLFLISTSCHPFNNNLKPVSSSQLEETLLSAHDSLSKIVTECELSDKYKLLNRSRKRTAPLSLLNDLWWEWVNASLECNASGGNSKQWAKEVLLPYYYWKQQAHKTRKKHLKKYYLSQMAKARDIFDGHPLTETLLSRDWEDWAIVMSQKYQRTTSAIEGRNARLSEHYFNLRGLVPKHLKALTTLHNFRIKREDQTTAVERLFKVKPPDLFQWILNNVEYLPLPRQGTLQNLAV